MAAVVATEEPEIAAKNVQATIDTREIPPEIQLETPGLYRPRYAELDI